MYQSKLFTKTRKEAPSEEVAKNASLLIRAGYIHKQMSGVYEFLPLGLRVINKISNIVREEMNKIGGLELKMTVLQDSEHWQKSGRWDDSVVDNWFKSKLSSGAEVGLANTHEEALSSLLKQYIDSYKDLPIYPYQIQVKFRNELRAKSGILRGREFLMKDMYSFSRNQEEHDAFYETAKEAYKRVFTRAGIGDRTFLTFASGGSFSKFSHEFQTLTDSGEDTIYLDKKKKLAINKEVYNDEGLQESGLNKDDLEEVRAIEVGNIFPLGTKYAEAVGLKFKDEKGQSHTPIMGSYGIGVSRLMGAVVEVLATDKGLVWPENIAPFKVHLISLKQNEEAEKIYQQLQEAGVEVLYDDRDLSAGEKFNDADLIGLPYRVVISEKTIKEGKFELKKLQEDEANLVSEAEILKILTS